MWIQYILIGFLIYVIVGAMFNYLTLCIAQSPIGDHVMKETKTSPKELEQFLFKISLLWPITIGLIIYKIFSKK